MALDEPPGWRKLQERAQQERDPEKVAAIIDEMNQLLTAWEKRANLDENKSPRTDSRKGSAPV